MRMHAIVNWYTSSNVRFASHCGAIDAAVRWMVDAGSVTLYRMPADGANETDASMVPYSIAAVERMCLEADSSHHPHTVGFWNAEARAQLYQLFISLSKSSYVPCMVSLDRPGSVITIYTYAEQLCNAASVLSARRSRAIDIDTAQHLAMSRHSPRRGWAGIVTYLCDSQMHAIDGFMSRRHGDGVLYVMDRQLAESGVEARAAAILRLQPLYDSLM